MQNIIKSLELSMYYLFIMHYTGKIKAEVISHQFKYNCKIKTPDLTFFKGHWYEGREKQKLNITCKI